MKVRPGACIIRDQRLLTLKYTYPGGVIYSLPGGNLEFGEELHSALNRELEEELGISCPPGDILHIAEVLYQGENTIHFIFKCGDISCEPRINPAETKAEEVAWLPLKELDHYTLYPQVGKFLADETAPVFLGVIEQPRY